MWKLSPEEVSELSVDPLGEVEDLVNFRGNACSNFYINLGVEIDILNMWTSTRVQLLDEFGCGSQIYMGVDDHFPTHECQNHCCCNFK